jgi:DNA modification methylase
VSHNINPALAESAAVVPISELRYFEGNARRHDIDLIRESLRVNGQFRAIAVWRNSPLGREVLAGNGTLQAAIEENWTHIACTYVTAPDRETAAKMVLVDNRANDQAWYEPADLAELLKIVPDYSGTGFSDTAVDRILADNSARFAEPSTPAPEPDREPITREGDRIRLGAHVLVCGDARDEAAWQSLLHEDLDRISLVWSDPPYGVDLHAIASERGRDHGDMAGDAIDPEQLERLVYVAFGWAIENAADQCSFYVCHADTMRMPVQRGLEAAGWSPRQTVIWAKDHLVVGRQDYQWMHEPILYGWRADGTHRWYGERVRTTIIDGATRASLEALDHETLVETAWTLIQHEVGTLARYARPQVARDHPTAKPLDMVQAHIHNSSAPGDLVADPFAGSGTTLLAAEAAGRRARAIELEPIHCDTIVTRWQEMTGETAERPKHRRKAQTA